MRLRPRPLLALAVLVALYGCNKPADDGQAAARPVVPVSMPPSHAASRTDSLQARLVAAYPGHLDHADGNWIVWKDGTRMAWDDGKAKTDEEREADPDLEDMFHAPYPLDSVGPPVAGVDPGRYRNEAFFRKMYGGTAAEVEGRLGSRGWPEARGKWRLQVTKVNGVDSILAVVAAELSALPALRPYLETPGGGYYWRKIAGTDRLSAHSWGIAIDINTAYSDYWRWSPEFQQGKPLRYRNRVPMAVVRVFERHGFIWGGKWHHYDTMHFEYRPELL